MTDLLELGPSVESQLRAEAPHALHYDVTSTDAPSACPACGSAAIKKHGLSRAMYVSDTPRAGKPVGLWLRQQRIRCLEPGCGRAITVRPDWMDLDFRATTRLIQAVQRDALRLTFTYVARQYGIDERTVRDIFDVHIDQLDRDRLHSKAPRVLGIDETSIKKRPALVLTDIEQGRVLELHPTRDYGVLRRLLARYRAQGGVQVATLDMHQPYRNAVRQELPGVVVVVDKFHVLALIDQCMDADRRAFQAHKGLPKAQKTRVKKLRHFLKIRPNKMDVFTWGRMHAVRKEWPGLYELWDGRNALYAVYDAPSRQEAERRYDEAVAEMGKSMRATFRPVLTALRNWREEIFSYFDHRYTNAATEALNGVIQLLNATGRGYSFRILRAKVLYAPKYQRRTTVRWMYSTRLDIPDAEWRKLKHEETLDLGVDLAELFKDLKAEFPGLAD